MFIELHNDSCNLSHFGCIQFYRNVFISNFLTIPTNMCPQKSVFLNTLPLKTIHDNTWKMCLTILRTWSRGSSVSIVSGYRLGRAIKVRSPAETRDFSPNLCVQTGSGDHPASCTMGTSGPFPGVKHSRGATLTTHPHLAPRSGMSRS
jgi:hypothetical protein